MREELYIDGVRFDLGQSSISQTYQVNDLADLKNRRANLSNTIRLPKTPNNIMALNYLSVVGSLSRAPYKLLSAKHIVNGIEIISNGYARIRSMAEVIEAVIYSGNISLQELIQDKTLKDLDYSDINHYLNLASFEDGMLHDDRYVYALGDFGIEPPANSGMTQIQWQLPSLYFATIWDKIFREAGATYSGDVFQDVSFLEEVLPPANGIDIDDVNETKTLIATIDSDTARINETSNTEQEYTHHFELTNSGSTADVDVIDDQMVQVNYDGVLRITVETSYFLNNGVLRIDTKKNGSTIKTEVITDKSGSAATTEINLAVRDGDVFTFVARGRAESTDPVLPIFKCDFEADLTIDFEKTTGGLFIDFTEIVPATTQEQFLKDVMQRYALVFRTVGKNHYEFRKMEDILNDRPNSEDWSDKLKVEDTEDYEFGSFGQKNIFKYNYTDDEEDFAQNGILISTNKHNKPIEEMIESVFTISERSGKSINRDLYSVPVWEGKYDEDSGDLEEVKLNQIPARIFKAKRESGNINVKFFDSQINTIAGDIPMLSLEDIQMDFYISRYYKAYNRILNAPKVRKDFFYLSTLDIHHLDFFKLKYIKQLGQYYYLNRVSSFQPGKLTKCELIQVNGISKGVEQGNQPPTQLGVREITIGKGATVHLTIDDFIDTIPQYFDPEYDAPEKIKIISFGITHTRMQNNGVIILSDTIVDAQDFNLRVKDFGTTNQAHTAKFQFKIQSFGNPNFSNATGEIIVRVLEYINRPPVANAGSDIIISQDPDIHGNNYVYDIDLNGCESYDPDGDPITYDWELIDAPNGVTLSQYNICDPILHINIQGGSDLIKFKVKLTVEDPEGLTDEDTIDVTLTTFANNG